MSSRDSPPLNLNVGKRRAEGWCATLLIALAVLTVALLTQGAYAAAGLWLALAGAGPLAYGMRRATWFGPRRLVRIAWLADGRWELAEGTSAPFEATLRADTRVGSHYVWLRWDTDIVRSMLLFHGDLTEADLRRLIVRLRIEGLRNEASQQSADKGANP
jgi:hypothetical protein